MAEKIKRIAIMGGTFDPIHFGHLVTSEAVKEQFHIDKVLFIPSGQPPHKKDKIVSAAEQRYMMTLLATESNPSFFPSRIEIDREGYSYTIDTIRQLKKDEPEAEIYFITGADAFLQILTWRNPEELLRSCHFVAATRPGYTCPQLTEEVNRLSNEYGAHIHFIEVPALSISSSDIRQRVREGKSIKYLLPETVENYIYKHGVYK